VESMGSDLTVVNAARVSFAKESTEITERDRDLIRMLADGLTSHEMGVYSNNLKHCDNEDCMREFKREPQHFTPFAHPHISIRMTIPIFLARQLVKHQVGGVWSEESRRYIDSDPEFWKPRSWRRRAASNKQGSGRDMLYQSWPATQLEIATKSSLEIYRALRREGVCPEQARIVLPLNTMSNVYWTGSLYFFSRVYNNRIGAGAQKEAREFARALGAAIEPLFPISWAALTGG